VTTPPPPPPAVNTHPPRAPHPPNGCKAPCRWRLLCIVAWCCHETSSWFKAVGIQAVLGLLWSARQLLIITQPACWPASRGWPRWASQLSASVLYTQRSAPGGCQKAHPPHRASVVGAPQRGPTALGAAYESTEQLALYLPPGTCSGAGSALQKRSTNQLVRNGQVQKAIEAGAACAARRFAPATRRSGIDPRCP
jgi:hypothetical protein